MKKLLTILLAAMMLLSLCACNVEKPNDSNSVDSENSPVSLPDDVPVEDDNGEVGDEIDIVIPEPEVELPYDPEENENGAVPEEDDMLTPFSQSVENDEFTLTLTANKCVYYTGEEIHCEAVLSPKSYPITVYGSAGLGAYSIEGSTYFNNYQGAATTTSELGVYKFDGEDMIYPLSKSGGWSASDPDAAFYTAFFTDKAYTLPAGVYTITIHISYSTDENDIIGSTKRMQLSYPIEVIDNGVVPEFMQNMNATTDTDTPRVEVNGYDTGVSYTMSQSDAQAVLDIFEKEMNFTQEAPDCYFDVALVVNGDQYLYHTGCGTLCYSKISSYTKLAEEDKNAINAILEKNLDVVVEEPVEDVIVDEPVAEDFIVDEPTGDVDLSVYVMPADGVEAAIMSDSDTDVIKANFYEYAWKDTIGNCMDDVILYIDGMELNYHRDCGTVNNYDWMKCITLDEDDKLIFNEIIDEYLKMFE